MCFWNQWVVPKIGFRMTHGVPKTAFLISEIPMWWTNRGFLMSFQRIQNFETGDQPQNWRWSKIFQKMYGNIQNRLRRTLCMCNLHLHLTPPIFQFFVLLPRFRSLILSYCWIPIFIRPHYLGCSWITVSWALHCKLPYSISDGSKGSAPGACPPPPCRPKFL